MDLTVQEGVSEAIDGENEGKDIIECGVVGRQEAELERG